MGVWARSLLVFIRGFIRYVGCCSREAEMESRFFVESIRLSSRVCTRSPIVTLVPYILRSYTLNPKPSIHALYCCIVDLQSSSGFAALDMSMHSSRCAFSSLHTQHGWELFG